MTPLGMLVCRLVEEKINKKDTTNFNWISHLVSSSIKKKLLL
jgi:hypothetical protein